MWSAERTDEWLRSHREDLVELTRELVAFASENRPPDGNEGPCQELVAERLHEAGAEVDVFRPDEVEAAVAHPLWWPGRSYQGRPCVVGRRSGVGGGRSLLLSGHVDVVPALGEGTHGFWDGDVEDGRLYGRGACDMKAGVACALHAYRCLAECDVALAGDVIVESVVDEEFGGANGTLAARLRGYHADGAVLSEPTGMTVCHATRGGIQYRLTVAGGALGMGFEGDGGPGALTTLARISAALDDLPRDAPLLQYLLRSGEELPWGTAEGLPGDGVLEFWAEITPGTDRAAVDAELRAAVDAVVPEGIDVRWEQRTRFLEAADVGAESPIVQRMRTALGTPDAAPAMAPFACDAFIFAVDGTPVVICGPRGGNAHAPDEWVLIEDLYSLSEAFVRLAIDWCGEVGADDGN